MCHGSNRQRQKVGIVAAAILQRNPTEDQIPRSGNRRLFGRQLHDSSNPLFQKLLDRTAIGRMADKHGIGSDFIHRLATHSTIRGSAPPLLSMYL